MRAKVTLFTTMMMICGLAACQTAPPPVQGIGDQGMDVNIIQRLLASLGMKAAPEGKNCDATLKTSLTFQALEVNLGDGTVCYPAIDYPVLTGNSIEIGQLALQALRAISGQDFGEDAGQWQAWWQTQKDY